MLGYLEKGTQTPMAQGRSTEIISMIKWIRTSRLPVQNSLSLYLPQRPEKEFFIDSLLVRIHFMVAR